ncbi:hypothetical protein P7C70_g8498, partial [Phenoliferia sp. Uapishka_3]
GALLSWGRRVFLGRGVEVGNRFETRARLSSLSFLHNTRASSNSRELPSFDSPSTTTTPLPPVHFPPSFSANSDLSKRKLGTPRSADNLPSDSPGSAVMRAADSMLITNPPNPPSNQPGINTANSNGWNWTGIDGDDRRAGDGPPRRSVNFTLWRRGRQVVSPLHHHLMDPPTIRTKLFQHRNVSAQVINRVSANVAVANLHAFLRADQIPTPTLNSDSTIPRHLTQHYESTPPRYQEPWTASVPPQTDLSLLAALSLDGNGSKALTITEAPRLYTSPDPYPWDAPADAEASVRFDRLGRAFERFYVSKRSVGDAQLWSVLGERFFSYPDLPASQASRLDSTTVAPVILPPVAHAERSSERDDLEWMAEAARRPAGDGTEGEFDYGLAEWNPYRWDVVWMNASLAERNCPLSARYLRYRAMLSEPQRDLLDADRVARRRVVIDGWIAERDVGREGAEESDDSGYDTEGPPALGGGDSDTDEA